VKAIKPLFNKELEPYPATRFFDQLSFIGNPNVGCFVLETSGGIVMIDCMEPRDEYVAMIEKGFVDLGLQISDLKAILITHGHGDHYGKANHFRDKYGCKIYMSKIDYEYALKDYKSPVGVLPFEIEDFLDDMEGLILGDMEITCVLTPGHTPGGLSFIFPVTDEGVRHVAGIWGGTAIPRDSDFIPKYLESIRRFSEICGEKGCDVEICSHPFVNNGIERLDIIRNITDGVHNPFVVGEDGFQYSMKALENMCLSSM
jgi:metallo-beta-lactamase class B